MTFQNDAVSAKLVLKPTNPLPKYVLQKLNKFEKTQGRFDWLLPTPDLCPKKTPCCM